MTIATADPGATPTVVRKGPERVDAPRLSPSGNRVAFQMMLRDDWELVVINRDGSAETRVTRDIQHDLLPQFLSETKLLGVIGEPRHRRSFLYDIETGTRTRLFHNNTVRTIAPEYSWELNADGSKLLIVAERDGDTVSLERGVYLMDLARTVTREQVRARVAANLAAEEALQGEGHAALRADCRCGQGHGRRGLGRRASTATRRRSSSFDSKHITRPGNKLASAYLFDTYKSFGYAPEFQWFERAECARRPDRQRRRHAQGHGQPRADLRRQQPLRFGGHRSWRRRRLVGHGGAARNGAASWPGVRSRRRSCSRRSRARRPACSAAASSCAAPSPTNCCSSARSTTTWSAGRTISGWTTRSATRIAASATSSTRAAMEFTNLITYDALYYKGTDAAAYYEAYGDIVGGIGSYPVLSSPHYHQSHDVLENMNHQLDHRGRKDDGCDAGAARVEPVAADRAQGRQLLRQLRDRVVEAKPGEGRHRLHRRVWPARETRGAADPRDQAGRDAVERRRRHAIAVKAVNSKGLEGWDWARRDVVEVGLASWRRGSERQNWK